MFVLLLKREGSRPPRYQQIHPCYRFENVAPFHPSTLSVIYHAKHKSSTQLLLTLEMDVAKFLVSDQDAYLKDSMPIHELSVLRTSNSSLSMLYTPLPKTEYWKTRHAGFVLKSCTSYKQAFSLVYGENFKRHFASNLNRTVLTKLLHLCTILQCMWVQLVLQATENEVLSQ